MTLTRPDSRRSGEQDGDTGEAQTSGNTYGITVLNRAMDVLEVFTPGRPTLGLRDIVRQTGLPKTTVFRILSNLVERGYCQFDPNTAEYSLGFVFLKFADIRRRQTNLHDVATPIMRQIRDTVNETVVLSIRTGDQRIHIDSIESLQSLKRTVEIGVPAPLYVGASSKVLLAGMSDNEIEDYLETTELVPLQKTTITDREKLLEEVRMIRTLGYAESKGELISGGGALAAPVTNFTGQTIAAIDILTPQERYTPEHRKQCIECLLELTRIASQRLGAPTSSRNRA